MATQTRTFAGIKVTITDGVVSESDLMKVLGEQTGTAIKVAWMPPAKLKENIARLSSAHANRWMSTAYPYEPATLLDDGRISVKAKGSDPRFPHFTIKAVAQ